MYLVIEIQKNEAGQLAWLVTQHEELRDAESKYHTVLAAAAKTTLPRHSAAIIHEDGHSIEQKSYRTEEVGEE